MNKAEERKIKRDIKGWKRVIESDIDSHHYDHVAMNYEHIAEAYQKFQHAIYAKIAYIEAAIYYIKAEWVSDAIRILKILQKGEED